MPPILPNEKELEGTATRIFGLEITNTMQTQLSVRGEDVTVASKNQVEIPQHLQEFMKNLNSQSSDSELGTQQFNEYLAGREELYTPVQEHYNREESEPPIKKRKLSRPASVNSGNDNDMQIDKVIYYAIFDKIFIEVTHTT